MLLLQITVYPFDDTLIAGAHSIERDDIFFLVIIILRSLLTVSKVLGNLTDNVLILIN